MMRRPTSEQRCQEVRARLRERTALTPLEERRISAHVGNCPSCGAEQWLQTILGQAAAASREPLPAERVEALWAGIASQLAHEVEAKVLVTDAIAPAAPVSLVKRRARWLAPAMVMALAASVAVGVLVVGGEERGGTWVVAENRGAKTETRGPTNENREPTTENQGSTTDEREPPNERRLSLAAAEARKSRRDRRQRSHEAPTKAPIESDTSTYGGGVAAFRGEARSLELSSASLSAGEELYARANAHRARGELVEAERLLAELTGHDDVALANAARLDRARLLAHAMNDPARAVATLRAGRFDAAAPLDAELRITSCSLLLELSRVDEARMCIDELRTAHPRRARTPAVEKLSRRLAEVTP